MIAQIGTKEFDVVCDDWSWHHVLADHYSFDAINRVAYFWLNHYPQGPAATITSVKKIQLL